MTDGCHASHRLLTDGCHRFHGLVTDGSHRSHRLLTDGCHRLNRLLSEGGSFDELIRPLVDGSSLGHAYVCPSAAYSSTAQRGRTIFGSRRSPPTEVYKSALRSGEVSLKEFLRISVGLKHASELADSVLLRQLN